MAKATLRHRHIILDQNQCHIGQATGRKFSAVDDVLREIQIRLQGYQHAYRIYALERLGPKQFFQLLISWDYKVKFELSTEGYLWESISIEFCPTYDRLPRVLEYVDISCTMTIALGVLIEFPSWTDVNEPNRSSGSNKWHCVKTRFNRRTKIPSQCVSYHLIWTWFYKTFWDLCHWDLCVNDQVASRINSCLSWYDMIC